MQALIAFFMLNQIFWGSLAILLIACIIADIAEELSYIVGAFIIFAGVQWWFDTAWAEFFTLGRIAGYLLFGFAYSIIRVVLKGREFKTKIAEAIKSGDERKLQRANDDKEYYRADKMKPNVFRWIIIWPVSILTWFCGDAIVKFANWCWRGLKGFYNMLFDF